LWLLQLIDLCLFIKLKPCNLIYNPNNWQFRSLINRLQQPSLLLLHYDPLLAPSLAPPITFWSIACTIRRTFYCLLIHRSFNCSLIHCSHNPSLLLLFADPSLAAPIAPSISPWSTARTIHRSSYCSLIHRLQPLSMIYCRSKQASPPIVTSAAVNLQSTDS